MLDADEKIEDIKEAKRMKKKLLDPNDAIAITTKAMKDHDDDNK